jgi:hypothetical protein
MGHDSLSARFVSRYSMGNQKLKYLATVAPFMVIMVVMAAWMLSDLVAIEQVGADYLYRFNHDIGLLFLPFCGFCVVSAIFIGKIGRLALVPAAFFLGLGLYAGWLALLVDASNQHVRVSPEGVKPIGSYVDCDCIP